MLFLPSYNSFFAFNLSVVELMIIFAAIGIIVAIVLLVCFHLYFKKKEKEILRKIEME